MSRARLAFGLVLFAAGTLPAQSIPSITKTKQAATHAVDATNAHTAAMTADQQAAPAPSAGKPAADSARAASPARATQSAAGSTAVSSGDIRPLSNFERETYSYQPAGRRDPFLSLMSSGDLRPVITDLVVAGIMYDPAGRNSVVVLRDVSSKEQYRAHVGQSVGRNRVARIDAKSVTFTIEEFGFSRQETLALNDSNKERTK